MTKQPQSAVDYVVRSTHANERCDLCTMFRPPYGCTGVKGHIKPGGWCKLFYRKVRRK